MRAGAASRALAALALLLLPAAARTTHAQAPTWKGKVATSASLFFGASSQRLVASSGSLARGDSAMELSAAVQFRYGDAEAEGGDRFVSSRAWLGTLSLDLIPEARLTPFASGTVERSLEKRIALRSSGGAGAKWVVARHGDDSFDVSLAALGERTRSQRAGDSTTARLRWSARVRLRRQVQERLRLSTTTFYQPAMRAAARYTLVTRNQVTYALTGSLGLTLSLVDSYDSEAESRGARSNNDGQFLAGIEASF